MNILNGNIKVAMHSVRTTRWRSLLTTSGIIIGICSVVTIVSIGEGIKHQVAGQINQLGKDLITVRPGVSSYNSLSSYAPFNDASLGGGSLNSNDAQIVAQTPGVKYSSSEVPLPPNSRRT